MSHFKFYSAHVDVVDQYEILVCTLEESFSEFSVYIDENESILQIHY